MATPAPDASLVDADIVVLIPTLKKSPRLTACIESVLRSARAHEQASGQGTKVLVVINGGDGATAPATEGDVTYIETGVNLGWAGGLVFGYERVSSRFVWVIQDDMTVDDTCLTNLMRAMEEHPEAGAVRPVMLDKRGRIARRSVGGYLDVNGGPSRGWPMRSRPTSAAIPDDMDYVAGSGLLIRGEAWQQAGGWDWRYYPVGYADVDFNARLKKAGWTVRVVTTAHAHHEGSASSPTNTRYLLAFHNRRRFAANWRPQTNEQPPVNESPNVHPDVSKERLAELLSLSNSALFDIDEWLATQRIYRPFRQRVRGLYWTARAFITSSL